MKKILILIFVFSFSIFFANAQEVEPKTIQNSDNVTGVEKMYQWYKNNTNYGTITILMIAESSILPVPSELVIPPASYIALDEKSNLNIFFVILFGTIGALIGATLNYFVLGMWIGRPLIYKFAGSKAGHLLLLSEEKLQKSEDYFNKNGKISTFFGRFIPVVRHLISIPAGFSKMHYLTFALFTFAGAGIWNCVLAFLGYITHGQADLIKRYAQELSIGLVVLCILVIVFLIIKNFSKRKK